MVNVEATGHPARPLLRSAATAAPSTGETVIRVSGAHDMALDDYAIFCAHAVHGAPQHPVWINAWKEATGADIILVTVERAGRPAFALALEVADEGFCRVARVPGGRHANGNFIATARDAGGALTRAEGARLAEAIRSARPDIDLIAIERQNPRQEGLDNPLGGLSPVRSPDVSLSFSLEGGFDATIGRQDGKRKPKKHRAQQRKFEQMGGYRVYAAGTPEEVETVIATFFTIKRERLLKAGIADAFAAPEIQAFFRKLFTDALDARPLPYQLHALEVGGEIRAINGSSILADSVVCEFGGIRDDEPGTSPGFFLEFDCIREACEAGKGVYDFSVGDEPYKRRWCDIETWQFDTCMPLGVKGRLFLLKKRTRDGLVGLVKSNDRLWSAVKRLRAGLANRKGHA